MKVIDEAVLDHFREKTVCEACLRPLRYRAHPHHLWARGLGGGSRIDHPWNLITLGGNRDCNCHGRHHDGNTPTRDFLIEVVAKREGVTADQVQAEIWRLLREPRSIGGEG